MNDVTRRISIWLANDSNLYQEMLSLANSAESEDELAKNIKSFIEENNPLENQNGIYNDLMTAALMQVNYRELAAEIWEDRETDESEEDEE